MPVFVDRLQRWRDDVKGRLAQVAVIDVARGTAKGASLEITRADDTAFPRRGHVDGKTGRHGLGRCDDVGVRASGGANDDPTPGSSVAELHIVTLGRQAHPQEISAPQVTRENPWSTAARMHLPMKISPETVDLVQRRAIDYAEPLLGAAISPPSPRRGDEIR